VAITLSETFRVQAAPEEVWAFVMDAHRVADCMPGASLDEMTDERTFAGNIRVKIGAVTATYRGRVQFVRVDEVARAVEVLAEGREAGGGTAKGTMSSRLRSLDGGETEVAVEASVEVTGRIAQMGRGMIDGVSRQLFQQFVMCAKASLETPAEAAEAVARANEPVRIVPLVLRALWAAIVRFLRWLFRRAPRDA
jgi:carbon monoxide dehydrogenase subunit G